MKDTVAAAAEGICASIAMAGVQGLYGDPGRKFGIEITLDMVGRQTE